MRVFSVVPFLFVLTWLVVPTYGTLVLDEPMPYSEVVALFPQERNIDIVYFKTPLGPEIFTPLGDGQAGIDEMVRVYWNGYDSFSEVIGRETPEVGCSEREDCPEIMVTQIRGYNIPSSIEGEYTKGGDRISALAKFLRR